MRTLLTLLFCLSLPLQADEFVSGVAQNQLVELYTSEGCSSCPPAERFLATQQDSEYLWERRFPLAFHVDYWDGLGWPDPYAKNQFTRRQAKYHRLDDTDSVYTPQFVVAGQEWRGYFARKTLAKPPRRKVGVLSIKIHDGSYQATFQAHKPDDKVYVLNLAQLAMNVRQKVTDGENRGRELEHQFVVTELQHNANQGKSWSGTLANSAAADAYVAWISPAGDLTPIQVTGGFSATYQR